MDWFLYDIGLRHERVKHDFQMLYIMLFYIHFFLVFNFWKDIWEDLLSSIFPFL